MTDLLPRKRLQIRLSTAIVLMFVAGGMIWGNAEPKRSQLIYSIRNGVYNVPDNDGTLMTANRFFGWPIPFLVTIDHWVLENGKWKHEGDDGTIYDTCWYSYLATDGLVALAILFAVWFLCEWLIRRRAARKEA